MCITKLFFLFPYFLFSIDETKSDENIDVITISDYRLQSKVRLNSENKIEKNIIEGCYQYLELNVVNCIEKFLFKENHVFCAEDILIFNKLISSCKIKQNEFFYIFYFQFNDSLYVGYGSTQVDDFEYFWIEFFYEKNLQLKKYNLDCAFSFFVKHPENFIVIDGCRLFCGDEKFNLGQFFKKHENFAHLLSKYKVQDELEARIASNEYIGP